MNRVVTGRLLSIGDFSMGATRVYSGLRVELPNGGTTYLPSVHASDEVNHVLEAALGREVELWLVGSAKKSFLYGIRTQGDEAYCDQRPDRWFMAMGFGLFVLAWPAMFLIIPGPVFLAASVYCLIQARRFRKRSREMFESARLGRSSSSELPLLTPA